MTVIIKNNGDRQLDFSDERLHRFIEEQVGITDSNFADKAVRSVHTHDELNASELTNLLVKNALEEVDEVNPSWTFTAARIYLLKLYKEASKNRSYDSAEKYGDFYGLIKTLAGKGIYSPVLLEKYSKEEIKEFSTYIVPERDLLFTYPGLHTLSKRYLVTDHQKNVYELPQERWLIIAMTLMRDEKPELRKQLVADAYWALSNLYMTVATPTLSNSGLAYGQLSSCFIDTVDDSLLEIYNSNTDVATLSKGGGGIGVYMGKVRSKGSSIRGYTGASSGVLPWIKQLNNTAVSVDQLGQRQGAIAVYLDIWHKDIQGFLDLRLNNGDDRLRAHDIFTGVCLPDVFMEQVDKRGDWYLFDPHEVREVMGFSIEDYYDETRGAGSFRDKYEECVQNNNLSKTKVPAIDLMKRIMKSQLETGVPFMFYRDEVNRMNPNKHEGMIYSSNLCTEIMQNMSATIQTSQMLDDGEIIIRKTAGDFVVCNLSSINLGKAVPADVLEKLIPLQVRMLDNVIELNSIEVLQAHRTNQRYRGIGLGTFGWHHLLALKGIAWESQEAVDYADVLYEKINFLTIQASMELAKEKGAYPLFEGSDWHTGEYFTRRQYGTYDIENEGRLVTNEDWNHLSVAVHSYGIRNGYLMAVAPNASTSVIAGSTASIDPIFKPFYSEEKKNYKLPVVAPDLDHNTYDVYRRSAYIVDQRWSVRQNAARQRHIDQSVSFNIYVPNTIKASVLLNLHLQAWNAGLKTTYYTRSTALELVECEWCAS